MLLTLRFFSAASGAQPHIHTWKFFIPSFPQILQDGGVRRLTSHADQHTRAVHEILHTVDLEGSTRETLLLNGTYFTKRCVLIRVALTGHFQVYPIVTWHMGECPLSCMMDRSAYRRVHWVGWQVRPSITQLSEYRATSNENCQCFFTSATVGTYCINLPIPGWFILTLY